MSNPILPNPEEVFDDIISLCAKVCHDSETTGKVFIGDVLELRDTINTVRQHLSSAGFKTIPKLKKEDT